ncbi:MAG TPA: zinc-binding dehydrogenase [Polyangiaceae bacterium]
MKAVHALRFGDPDVLSLVDLPDPTPEPGQVAIDVSHAAVGLIDVFFRRGLFGGRPGFPKPPFVPGLEVAGTVRALGSGVTDLSVGERVVTFSSGGTGGYASIVVCPRSRVFSTAAHDIDPALAVATVPNAAMAHMALASVARVTTGKSVLVHGALGGFASAFPAVAKKLGASRVIGTVRASKLAAAAKTKLPYDRIVDSAKLLEELAGESFDVIVDPVGGVLRTQSLDLLAPFGCLLLVGNASGDFDHALPSNRLWFGCVNAAGFNAGAYVPGHEEELGAAVRGALEAASSGLLEVEVDVLPLGAAAVAHHRMDARSLEGRIVLAP